MGFRLIVWLCLGLALPLLLAFCIRFPKGNMKVHRATPLVLLTILSTVVELSLFICGINTPLYGRIYAVFEFAVIYYFFYHLTEYKKLLMVFLAVFIFSYLSLTIGWNGKENLKQDFYFILIEFLVVFVFSILWYIHLFKDMKVQNLLRNSDFYIVISLLLYFSTTFFLFLSMDYLLKNYYEEFAYFWNINLFAGIIFRTLLIVAVWKKPAI